MKFLCRIEEISEGKAKGFELDDLSLFAVKKFGELFVYINSCPHLGVALEWLPEQFLDSEGELIQCATHGALFTIDQGVCVSGPCTGESLDAVPFVQKDGDIFVLM